MTHHLEALPPWPGEGPPGPSDPGEDLWVDFDSIENDRVESGTLSRPVWWRWVAIAVVVAMVAAGPVAFVLSRLLS